MKYERVLQRLVTVEGHMRCIIQMVEEEAYGIYLLHQIQATEAALNKTNRIILEEYLNACIIAVVCDEERSEREQILNLIQDLFEIATKA